MILFLNNNNMILLLLIIIIIMFIIKDNKESFTESDKKNYDCIISINVHEKLDFLINQLNNIKMNTSLSYAVILNCNDYMFEECNKYNLDNNIYVNNVILNKKRFHGSLLNGIYNNIKYALANFEFKYFIVASSRSMFGNNLTLEDLDRITQIKEQNQNNNYDEWHWPSFKNTLLAEYYLEQNKDLYKSPHEGLLITKNGCYKIVNFLESHPDIKNDLFNFDGCVEEFGFQTILMNSDDSFHYIGNGCCIEKIVEPNNTKEYMYKVSR